MNKRLRTTLLTLLLAVVNVVMADTYSYTFTAKVFSAAGSQTLNGVSWTLATDGGYYGYDGTKGQQFGSGNNPAKEVTLSTSGISGKVTKVTVNASTASGGSASLYVTVGGTAFSYGTATSATLTTTATSYDFAGESSGDIVIKLSQPTTSKAMYIKSISVEYTQDFDPVDCDLSYSADSYTAQIGGTNSFPKLNNPNGVTGITYASSNTVVASVSNSGAVTLNSAGTTTITASFAGNNLYKAGSASYELTVIPAQEDVVDEDGVFVKVTDFSTLADGDVIIIVNEANNKALSTTQNNNNRGSESVSISSDYKIKPGSTVQQITLEGSEGAWYLKVGDGRYLYAASSSSNQLKTAAKSDNSKAKIEYNKGDADITFQGTYTRNIIRYNSGNDLFSCYASGQLAIQIYRMESPTTIVNSTEELAALDDDTNVKLVLADDINARVLYATDGEAYVRDNTGAFCMSGVTPNVPFASNQHIAGSIKGKKTSVDGMTVFEATTATNTALLAIAEPVTEEQPEPVAIEATAIDDNLADWVTIQAVRVGDDAEVDNRFGLDAADGFASEYAYEGALADIAAIARPEALCPVSVNEVVPYTFVVDETQEFVSPDADIVSVPVRLVRTLSSGYWNTLCLPFDVNIDGQVREYKSVSGNKMTYAEADGIKAGVPYLVKPDEDIENPAYDDVTLSATPASTVTFGDYSFVGTYSPCELLLDKTERFLGDGDNLYYPESSDNNANKLRGMRAFFRVPASSGANVDITGSDGIAEVDSTEAGDNHWYTLSGQRVTKPQRGVYVNNGKKVVVR